MHCWVIQSEKKAKSFRMYLHNTGFHLNERNEYASNTLLDNTLYITLVDVQDNGDSEYQVFVEAYKGSKDHSGGFKMHLVDVFATLPVPIRRKINALCQKIDSMSSFSTSTEPKSEQASLFLVQ